MHQIVIIDLISCLFCSFPLIFIEFSSVSNIYRLSKTITFDDLKFQPKSKNHLTKKCPIPQSYFFGKKHEVRKSIKILNELALDC